MKGGRRRASRSLWNAKVHRQPSADDVVFLGDTAKEDGFLGVERVLEEMAACFGEPLG